MPKKVAVSKVKQAVVRYDDGGEECEIRVTQNDGGYDIEGWADTPFVLRLTRKQWKSVVKAVKALKKGKKNRVVEEPESQSEAVPKS